MSRALTSKALTQLSAGGWDYAPPLVFYLRRPNSLGLWLGAGDFQEGIPQGGPSRLGAPSCGEPLLTHTSSTGDPTLSSFPLSLGMPENFVCALLNWSLLFPQSCGSLVIQLTGFSRQIPWGIWELAVLWLGIGWKPDMGLRTSWCYCSPVCGSSTQRVWIWSHHDCALLPSHCGFLSLNVGYLFGSFQCPVDGYQQLAVIWALTRGGEHMSFYLPSWTRNVCIFVHIQFLVPNNIL